MNMNKLMLSGVATGMLLGSQLASAAVFDFIGLEANGDSSYAGVGVATGTYADGAAYDGAPGEAAFQSFSWVIDGVTLSVWGTERISGDSSFAYLDSPTSNPAGLGVCSQAVNNYKGDNQCSPASDDNLDVEEVLHLEFASGKKWVNFSESEFRNASHNVFTPTEAEISIDGGSWMAFNPAAVVYAKHIALSFNPGSTQQMYLSSLTVPAPATLAILGLGLLGMGMVQRRKNRG
ncbi:MAG TPA: PEP-CTERM sorting domain-containing protein [Gammaproteobacteria bacterium]|nr:PEP-CTERM sorting domain-containing protein [Gammaproteobacteria bacterium]